MKLFKSLLLGSAAGLIAVSGASAADLGVKKPAPVEYVKVCSAHGAGFFYVPGSDVCMQISGRVRAEYLYASPYTRGDDASSFRGHGRINLDVRQTTQYGLLRAFVRMETYADSGRYVTHSTNSATSQPSQMGGSGYAFGSGDILNKAFIQFYTGTAGFFTAGRSVSFFDFYAGNDNYGRLIGSDRDNVNLFAYTATFGGGFSATLSVEDQYARRVSGAPLAALIGPTYAPAAVYGTTTYSGQRMPDVIANLRVDQAWGSAQLSAAVHQLFLSNLTTVAGVAEYPSTKYGWAIQGGVKINLPMIAAGDTLWLQAAYGQGANDFVGVTRAVNDTAQFGPTRNVAARSDAYVNTTTGNIKAATSWSVVASFVHNFTPSIQGAIYGAYGKVNYGSAATRVATAGPAALIGTNVGYVNFTAWQVGGRINWIPVRNFTIGTELMYSRIDPRGRVADIVSNPGIVVTGSKGAYDTVTARIRFQRDF